MENNARTSHKNFRTIKYSRDFKLTEMILSNINFLINKKKEFNTLNFQKNEFNTLNFQFSQYVHN